MTGPELWKVLLAAKIPNDELTALAKDVGHKEKIASEQGQHALAKLAYTIYQAGAYGTDGPVRASRIFQVLKDFMPFWGPSREKILYGLAEDRQKHRVWAAVRDEVRSYITDAAESLPHLVPLPAPTPPTTVVPSQEKKHGEPYELVSDRRSPGPGTTSAHAARSSPAQIPAPAPPLVTTAMPLRREEAGATPTVSISSSCPPN